VFIRVDSWLLYFANLCGNLRILISADFVPFVNWVVKFSGNLRFGFVMPTNSAAVPKQKI